eukprot:Rmarinus@m.23726
MENKTAKLFGKEDYFTCGVCFNLFDEHDRKPMVWPCGHTVCFECTEDLFARNQDTCPECRQESNKSNIIENISLMRMAQMAQKIHEDLYESMRCAQMANDQTLAINEQLRQQMADFAAAKEICENELLNEKKRYSSLEQQFLTEVEMAKQRELHMKQETEEMIRRLQGESEVLPGGEAGGEPAVPVPMGQARVNSTALCCSCWRPGCGALPRGGNRASGADPHARRRRIASA